MQRLFGSILKPIGITDIVNDIDHCAGKRNNAEPTARDMGPGRLIFRAWPREGSRLSRGSEREVFAVDANGRQTIAGGDERRTHLARRTGASDDINLEAARIIVSRVRPVAST